MGIHLHAPNDRDFDRAFDIFDRLTEKAGKGTHGLTLAVRAPGGVVTVTFPWTQTDDGMAASLSELHALTGLLAVAVSGAHPSGMCMRTLGTPDTVRGWRFTDGDPVPLTRAEAFDAYATNPETGEPVVPMPGTEYADAPVIHI
ncbi:hypothetical protein JHN53_35235 [Streptomyces sp. MBT58]|uniref:hypothetical protein n=1 Tax=Streptomyces sp. MBT58 TaxID=1488389 RepID=UPI0019140C64|nr:hypothetical protein [Streptomyces sp. MBT58]MBK5996777.1 hypothetical protein [Streptomyces sp. MBT58]